MPQIELNGTSLYYEVHGTGTPIVFLHDCRSSHHMFEPQIEYFGKRSKVIVLDLRGNGQSGKMNIDIPHILEAQCEDLQKLLNMLQVPQAVLVGYSSGGVLAQKFAALYPERVKALVLVDCLFESILYAKGKSLWELIEPLAWVTWYLPAEFFLRSLRVTYNRWLPAYSILRNEILHKRPTEAIKQRLALRQANMFKDLAKLKVPMLCVAGSQNEWGLKQMNQASAMLPLAQFAILKDAFYPSHLCQPHSFNRLLLNYLIDHQLV
ncbi:alpha/beta hydrolase [Paenibacillus sp. M1]|uniref:Alpha/beta hydrolase n=1 Tax=Paenibacillus haidiansis TaxID=1574488 RepID=A0ABU7VPQ9_9BACL